MAAINYIGLHPTHRDSAAVWVVDGKTVYADRQWPKRAQDRPWSEVRASHPGWTFYKLKLAPGEYYPRMARTTKHHLNDSPGVHPGNKDFSDLIQTSQGQLLALRDQLESIFRTVHPVKENFRVYGHDIRNLLLLACTEVESHWKGVLKANGVQGSSTRDYVKLLRAMKLDEYAVRLPYYPRLPAVMPFKGWKTSPSSQSLRWYAAYNAVKHDRETLFAQGTLLRSIEAVCACWIMISAQFGVGRFKRREELDHFFQLEKTPKWHVTEVYANWKENAYRPVPFAF